MGALYNYMQQVTLLLNDLKQTVVNPATLVPFINSARSQIAGEGECIRSFGAVSTTNNVRYYNYSNVDVTAVGAGTGVLQIRRINIVSGSGFKYLTPLSWEWFDLFYNNNAAPATGVPARWAQFAQGAFGSFALDPTPNATIVMQCDCVCYPASLLVDTTVETIPYPWTDAVQYYAAYLACLNAQRPDNAKVMMDLFKEFMQRARRNVSPAVMPYQFEQTSKAAPPNVANVGSK